MRAGPSSQPTGPISVGAAVVLSALSIAILLWRGDAAFRGGTLAAGDPIEVLHAEITAQFGMRNPIVWVVAPRDGTIWSSDALRVVQDLTREVLRTPGVIATEVVSLASPNVRDLAISEATLGSTYLMSSVPESPEEIAELRRRVEGNPNFRGSLVSLDGGAAMVVADFREDADATSLARQALHLSDKYRGADVDVWVAGAPVVTHRAMQELWLFAATAAAVLAAGLVTLALLCGTRMATIALLAGAAAVLWTAGGLALLGGLVVRWTVPWAAYALPPVAGISAAFVLAPNPAASRRVAAALLVGFACAGLLAETPAGSLGIAGVLGTASALAAASLLRPLSRPRGGSSAGRLAFHAWWREPALLAMLFCLFGLAALRGSFSSFGHGARYLPETAARDVRALGRHFPPPTAFAVRARGDAGFVKSPDVLRAFDRIVQAARRDPAVERAMSVADLVKMVHRAFNEGLEEFHAIPSESTTIGRYLIMSYSPGFRRFLDRSFSNAALWVFVRGDDPADLARVRDVLVREVEAAKLPGVDLDVIGGDGALALRAAEIARSVAAGWLIFALSASAVVAFLLEARTALRGCVGACAGAAVTCGLFGWLGIPIDLVSLAGIGFATALGWTFTTLGGLPNLAAAMAACAPVAAIASVLTGSLLGYAAAAPLLAPLFVGALLPADLSPSP